MPSAQQLQLIDKIIGVIDNHNWMVLDVIQGLVIVMAYSVEKIAVKSPDEGVKIAREYEKFFKKLQKKLMEKDDGTEQTYSN
jgi:hypothetical protein